MSQLLITLDDEIMKDIQYMSQYLSWHATAISQDLSHLKFRPNYNESVKSNPRKYWQYAIKSTLYYLKKEKQADGLKKKR